MFNLYENMTFRFILGRMLEEISDDVDKREGSVVYDALAPAAMELSRFYRELGNVLEQTFADSAGREFLIRRAAERGIIPYPATFAVVRGEFNAQLRIGERFALDDLRYRVIEKINANSYKLVCENIGSAGSRSAGDLVPVNYIYELTSAKITELLIAGEDDETTESLRRRYFDSLDTQSFGGNISDYKRIALAVPGVGGVKVYPAFSGGGTVKLVVQDYRWGVPSDTLIEQLKNIIDPAGVSGLGEGLAPIGHKVSVEAVCGVVIDISAQFVMTGGRLFDDIRSDLNEIIKGYFSEAAGGWAESDGLVIRASQIESRLLNHDGVLDISDLRLNGGLFGRNITLPADGVPLGGDISNVG
jgi:uncharacterized phage protein gp47/JayE